MIPQTRPFQIKTLDQLQYEYPALVAESHDGKRSDRYSFVSTLEIIESMESNDWGIRDVLSPKTRTKSNEHSKHLIRFIPKNPSMTIDDPRGMYKGLVPEIVMINSHDGTSKTHFMAGLFGIICGNGLINQIQDFGYWDHPHIRFSHEDAFKILEDYRTNIYRIADTINRMAKRILSAEEKDEYAKYVTAIRFPEYAEKIALGDKGYLKILECRRSEDKGDDVWRVFNVLQENAVKGGQKINARRSRSLTNIGSLSEVNKHIWNLGLEYLEYDNG